LSGKTEA